MSSNIENVNRKLLQEIQNYIKFIERQPIDVLSDENLYDLLIELQEKFLNYNSHFDENYSLFPLYKQSLYSRQRSVIANKCQRVVELLGFDYETDFVFASNIDSNSLVVDENESLVESNENSLEISRLNNKSLVRQFNSDNNLDFIEKINKTLGLQNQFSNKTNGSSSNLDQNSKIIKRSTSLTNLKLTFSDKMSSFDQKLANSLIPEFDGNPKEVEHFLDKCEFHHSQLNNDGKTSFVQFIKMMKLGSKVKNIMAITPIAANDNSFETLKTTLLNRFTDKTTKEEKMSQIERLYQKDSVNDFATKLEKLSAELVRLKMINTSEAARLVIQKEVEELAIRVFIRGLKRTEVRQALIYKEPRNLNDAIKFALEADAKFLTNENRFQINSLSANSNDNRWQNKNSRGRGWHSPNHNSQRPNRFNQNNQRVNSNTQNSNYNRGQGRGRGNNSSRGRSQYRNNYQNFTNDNNSNYNRNNNNTNNNSNNNNYRNNFRQNNNSSRGRTFNNRSNQNANYVNQASENQGNGQGPQPNNQPTVRLGDLSNTR